jgi:hypothetical protein
MFNLFCLRHMTNQEANLRLYVLRMLVALHLVHVHIVSTLVDKGSYPMYNIPLKMAVLAKNMASTKHGIYPANLVDESSASLGTNVWLSPSYSVPNFKRTGLPLSGFSDNAVFTIDISACL